LALWPFALLAGGILFRFKLCSSGMAIGHGNQSFCSTFAPAATLSPLSVHTACWFPSKVFYPQPLPSLRFCGFSSFRKFQTATRRRRKKKKTKTTTTTTIKKEAEQ
jgi:hypothetical protein